MLRFFLLMLIALVVVACTRTVDGATLPTATSDSFALTPTVETATAEPSELPSEEVEPTDGEGEPAEEETPEPAPTLLSAECVTGPHAIVRTQTGEEYLLNLEVARTPAVRSRGLMERTELDENSGMVFVYDEARTLVFWMRNTPLPLSIAFLAPDGEIVDIQDMEPYDESHHMSAAPAQYAVEVNQGYFERRGITVGDSFELLLDAEPEPCETAALPVVIE